jgi:hypothetical protein
MARRMGSHRAARPGSDVDVGCIPKLSHMNDYRLETRMTKHLVSLGVIEAVVGKQCRYLVPFICRHLRKHTQARPLSSLFHSFSDLL